MPAPLKERKPATDPTKVFHYTDLQRKKPTRENDPYTYIVLVGIRVRVKLGMLWIMPGNSRRKATEESSESSSPPQKYILKMQVIRVYFPGWALDTFFREVYIVNYQLHSRKIGVCKVG